MKLVIDGREYDGSAQPFIGDLRALKKKCGFGYGTVIDRMKKLDDDADIEDLLDDEDFLEAMIAWMWMSRLRAGERDLTFEEAAMVSLDGIQMLSDDSDEPTVAQDPRRAPTGSARGAGVAAAGSSPIERSTKTQKKRSTRA